jgi:hypothetical protein
MDATNAKDKEATTVAQSVIPLTVLAEIEADASAEGRSVSNVIARILGAHYAKRIANKPKFKKAA